MIVKVRGFGDLATLLGNELNVELSEDARIADLIAKISERVNGFGEKIASFSNRQGVTDFGLVILLNGINISLLEGVKTQLRDGDLVTFLPPIAGGYYSLRPENDLEDYFSIFDHFYSSQFSPAHFPFTSRIFKRKPSFFNL